MSSYKTRKTFGDTKWFTHDRFGMFIHWGLYSMPARHEWIKSYEMISDTHYDLYKKYFNPDMYDPKQWAKSAKDAGMKYVVFTAKHHEGFCMFDSKYTDYKCTNTSYKKDILKECIDAFREEGIHIGIYYSLIDWHHKDFTIDYNHPDRMNPNANEINKTRNMKNYAKYMRDQVTELMTNYGKIDILWFDYSYDDAPPDATPWFKGKNKDDWEAEKLIETARSINPDVIIDNRTGIDQDIWTPEQRQVSEWQRDKDGNLVTWEACHTFSGSWGYHRDEATWKSPEVLINMLVNTVSCGGNFIMNVGPTSRGYLDKRTTDGLKVYSDWMKYNGRSIYGCTMAEPEFIAPKGCVLTQSEDGKRLYIHLQEYPFADLKMNCLAGKAEYAQFLHDGSEITFTVGERPWFANYGEDSSNLFIFKIPQIKPNMISPVIEVFLK